MEKEEPRLTPAKGLRVLVIDDEKNIRTTLALCLDQIQCEVTAVATAQAALDALARQRQDLAFLDLRLGQSNGLELIHQLLAEAPDLMVVIMTQESGFREIRRELRRKRLPSRARRRSRDNPYASPRRQHRVDHRLPRGLL